MIEKSLADDPRILEWAARLEAVTPERYGSVMTVTLLYGAVTRLWIYADTHIDSTDCIGVCPAVLDRLLGIEKFTETAPDEWVKVNEQGKVILPNYQSHNGVEARRKAAGAKRAKRFRQRDKLSREKASRLSVTEALPSHTHTHTLKERSASADTKKAAPQAPPAPAATRGRRWGEKEKVPGPWKVQAQESRPDLDIEKVARYFENYWASKAGQHATKIDWCRTWQNWVAKEDAKKFQKAGAPKANGDAVINRVLTAYANEQLSDLSSKIISSKLANPSGFRTMGEREAFFALRDAWYQLDVTQQQAVEAEL